MTKRRQVLFRMHSRYGWDRAVFKCPFSLSMLISLFFILCVISCQHFCISQDIIGYIRPEHPLNEELFNALKSCESDFEDCGFPNDSDAAAAAVRKITSLCVRIANEHAALLLYDRAQDIFEDILYYVQPDNSIGRLAAHVLSALSFAQGRFLEVNLA